MRCRSSAVPHSLFVVDSSCGHNWCLFPPDGTVLEDVVDPQFRSLQSQSAESMVPIHFRCARRPQCPVRNLNIVVCSCLARRLIGSVEGQRLDWLFRGRCTATGSDSKLDLRRLPRRGSTYVCLSRSVSEIHFVCCKNALTAKP